LPLSLSYSLMRFWDPPAVSPVSSPSLPPHCHLPLPLPLSICAFPLILSIRQSLFCCLYSPPSPPSFHCHFSGVCVFVFVFVCVCLFVCVCVCVLVGVANNVRNVSYSKQLRGPTLHCRGPTHTHTHTHTHTQFNFGVKYTTRRTVHRLTVILC